MVIDERRQWPDSLFIVVDEIVNPARSLLLENSFLLGQIDVRLESLGPSNATIFDDRPTISVPLLYKSWETSEC